MGVEIFFVAMVFVFAITGLVRGYRQELGATIPLLVVIAALELIDTRYSAQVSDALNYALTGSGPVYKLAIKAITYCLLLLLVVFVAYQTDMLRFRGTSRSPMLGLSSGLINGYLLAGSAWYYLAQAGWPYLQFTAPYSEFYYSAWRLLPPNALPWPILLVVAALLLIARHWI